MIDLTISGWDAVTAWAAAWERPTWDTAAHAQAGAIVAEMWRAAALGAVLPGQGGPVRNPALAEAVTVEPSETGVRVSAPPELMPPTTGTPARDLKPALLHGPHSRQGHSGARYNIIPFRHAADRVPDEVFLSLVQTGTYAGTTGWRSKVLNGGQPVAAYQPLTGTFALPTHYTWAASPYAGIRLGAGGPVTFRTVSERSNPASWWVPAKPGIDLLRAVWAAAAPAVTAYYAAMWGRT